jgi:FKBP-type peptidyl-prolyl cis-trans isomerase
MNASALPPPPPPLRDVVTLEGGLTVETTHAVTGCDRKTKAGDPLEMHYTGTLAADGSKFDSSRDRGTPFGFVLGQGDVIAGWDEGLVGMCVGEKRLLTIPPALGYGDRGAVSAHAIWRCFVLLGSLLCDQSIGVY